MQIRKGKTPILSSLQEVYRMAAFANKPTMPPADEVLEMRRQNILSRRRFIGNLGKAGLSLTAGPLISTVLLGCKEELAGDNMGQPDKQTAKIAVVGAGIAGLNAAYQLRKQGIIANIYEAGATVGGRIRTSYHLVGSGLYTELGGEFINSDHKDILNLVQEFGIPLIDTTTDILPSDVFWVDNEEYSLEESVKDFQKITDIIANDQSFLEEDYDHPEFRRLDDQSLKAYLQSLPTSDKMKKLLEGAYTAEFGLDAEEQSPVYALYTIGTDTSQGLRILDASDQRYRIEGGNTKLIQQLASRLDGQIYTDHHLEAIQEKGQQFSLVFANGKAITADFVVLAVPLPILKEIKFQISAMSDEKHQAIQEMGMGQNAKLMMGFHTPIWRSAGYQGFLYGNELHNGWDHTHFQDYSKGAGYTVFQGGSVAVQLSGNVANPQIAVDRYLHQIAKAFGQVEDFNGRKAIANWPDHPLIRGSYLCPKVGQMHLLEVLAEPVGNLLFAGEHTSTDYQGYMNGGAESGRIVAEHILVKLNKPVKLGSRWPGGSLSQLV